MLGVFHEVKHVCEYGSMVLRVKLASGSFVLNLLQFFDDILSLGVVNLEIVL